MFRRLSTSAKLLHARHVNADLVLFISSSLDIDRGRLLQLVDVVDRYLQTSSSVAVQSLDGTSLNRVKTREQTHSSRLYYVIYRTPRHRQFVNDDAMIHNRRPVPAITVIAVAVT